MKHKKSNFVRMQRQTPMHITPLEFSLYNCYYCIVDCAFTLKDFFETLEYITTLSISPLNLSWW
jgi:hypothetical protein